MCVQKEYGAFCYTFTTCNMLTINNTVHSIAKIQASSKAVSCHNANKIAITNPEP